MADLTQTRANVTLRSRGAVSAEVAGEAIDQGMPIYQSGGEWFRAQAIEAKHVATRISLTKSAAQGDIVVTLAPNSDVDLGATLVVGETYVVSATLGAIAPIGDLSTGNYPRILGVANAANSLRFQPQSAGVAKA